MLDRDIHNAYARIRPDDAARERMRKELLSAAERARCGRPLGRIRVRRAVLTAAVLISAVVLTAFCYVTDVFGLRGVDLGPEELTVPELHGDGSLTYDTVTVDSISMQGLTDSPEYQACREWKEFLAGYDPDGALLAAVGNSPTGVSSEYEAYLCYTQEMADEVDRLCEKYSLALLGVSITDEDVDTLLEQVSAEGLFGAAPEGVSNEAYWGYRYSDGTFFLEGAATFSGLLPMRIDYQFSRAVKGSLSTLTLNVGRVADYTQWTYTTRNGVPLLLATNGGSKALVIADREESFVVVNVLGDWETGRFDVTRGDLEIFAESFDFTAIK